MDKPDVPPKQIAREFARLEKMTREHVCARRTAVHQLGAKLVEIREPLPDAPPFVIRTADSLRQPSSQTVRDSCTFLAHQSFNRGDVPQQLLESIRNERFHKESRGHLDQRCAPRVCKRTMQEISLATQKL